MANPNTAWRGIITIDDLNRFLTVILEDDTLYKSTYVSSGVYGTVFRIDVDMRVDTPYPFPTFYIGDSGIIYTSDNRNDRTIDHHIHRFCCKIMPIYTETDEVSYTNECRKQQDIYAKTNENLNAVCLPLFFYRIVATTEDSPLMNFIRTIMLKGLQDKDHRKMFGISFMPYSVNRVKLPNDPSIDLSARELLDSGLVRNEIDEQIVAISDENSAITLLLTNKHIYSYVVIVSLLIRLYFAGYCHGDLHLGNILVYNWPTAVTINTSTYEPTFFYPAFSLIDTGFAFRHGLSLPRIVDVRDYKTFKSTIRQIQTIRSPKSGHNMISWDSFHWFSKILMKNVGKSGNVSLHEDRCRFIHNLFCAFEKYRINFENQRISILDTLTQTLSESLLGNIRIQNHLISRSVDDYINTMPFDSDAMKIHQFNSYGGRHLNYYSSNRKQTNRMKTKITKKHTTHSVRRRHRRKSQHPRQRHSKTKHY
jgi:hypothetical protein